MEHFFNFFFQNWASILSGIIISSVIAFFSYRFSKKVAKPSYQKSSLRLIGKDENNLPGEVVVIFKGKEVERLTKTTLVFWNGGNESIDGKNIVESDPIKIAFDDKYHILSYKILERTRSVNNFTVDKDADRLHQLFLNFDYLDHGDGAVLELLHDSEEKYPRITGTIRGLPKGFIDRGCFDENEVIKNGWAVKKLFNNQKWVLVVAISLGLIMFIAGIAGIAGLVAQNVLVVDISHNFLVVGGIGYVAGASFLLWHKRRKYPKKLAISEIEPHKAGQAS